MDIETIISSVVISAAVSGLLSILSAMISKRSAEKIAEETTHREIEKLRQTWIRDDKVLYDKAFQEMIESVTRYIHNSNLTNQEEARTKTAIALSLSQSELAEKIRDLDDRLKLRPSRNAEACLRDVIACKQEMDAQEAER